MLAWNDQLGVDVGTATTQICLLGQGTVLREPSVIAYADERRRPAAVGGEAKALADRDVPGLRIVHPIVGGVVADFDAAVEMLPVYIRRALGRRPLFSPQVVTAATTNSTPVERRALLDALRSAGCGKVWMARKTVAAAIGTGMPTDTATSHLVVDIGAGTTDIAVISVGAVIASNSLRYAGDDFDEAIVRTIKRQQGMRIGKATAEEIKIRVGSLSANLAQDTLRVAGVSQETGDMETLELDVSAVPHVLRQMITPIAGEIRYDAHGRHRPAARSGGSDGE